MFHFCLSSNSKVIRNEFPRKRVLSNNLEIFFDDSVIVQEQDDLILFFSGILWQGEISQFFHFSEKSATPNGQFYCLVFNKKNSEIKVITDFIEDFPVYYSLIGEDLVVTSKLSSFSPDSFEICEEWVEEARVGRYREMYVSECEFPQSRNVDYSQNKTVLKNVFRVGHASVLNITTAPSISINEPKQYFTSKDYKNLFRDEIDFDKAKAITHEVLSSNLKKIPGEISICVSSGIDSALLMSLLREQGREFNGFGYSGKDSKREVIRWPSHFGIKNFEFDLESYTQSFQALKESWTIPSRHGDLAPEATVIKKMSPSNESLVKGSYGDEVFWHEPNAAMSVAIHEYQISDFDEHLEFLKDHYSYQPFQAERKSFERFKNMSFEEGIMSYHYFRHSYLKDDKIINNRMIYSPYQDLRLYQLLPRCNREIKVRSILNAELQFSLLTPEVREYINRHKSGGDELLGNVDYKKIKKDQLDWFIDNWKERELTKDF